MTGAAVVVTGEYWNGVTSTFDYRLPVVITDHPIHTLYAPMGQPRRC